jgi:tetratricopeptide (TPR) repeat protein
VRRRHDEYFLGVAEELDAHERLSGMRDLSPRSLDRFERELPSFRAVLASLLEDDRREGALRLGAALWRFWLNRTQYRDAAEWLERAPLDDTSVPLDVRASALAAAGAIALYVHDDVDRTDTLWKEGLELRREQDDPRELGSAFSRLASVAWHRGDYDGAIAFHKQALPLFELAGDEGSRLNELIFLGESLRDRGDYDEGERVLEHAAALARDRDGKQQLTTTVHSLGDLALDRTDPTSRYGGSEKRSRRRSRPETAASRSTVWRASPARGCSRETIVLPHVSGESPRTRRGSSVSGCSRRNGSATSG